MIYEHDSIDCQVKQSYEREIMKIYTTNFSKETIEFNTIMFVHFERTDGYHETKKILNSISVNDHPLKVAAFFENISNLMKTKKVRKSIFSGKEHFQFVLSNEDFENFPVKWFTLELDNSIKISHDIAFETTLIKRNDVLIPFGRFNLYSRHKLALYREYNMKRNAYKFISNEIEKSYFNK